MIKVNDLKAISMIFGLYRIWRTYNISR